MALAPGSRVGPYEIAEPIGAGGMGEVFRALDVNLGRSVAIKVLPSSVARDPERLARFVREAQTLGALNHPHIAQVFGLEKGDGDFRAIAMEFVEGPTLADRIAGAPLPVDEAIGIAIQIADALESAHDHGIIHRDLKPLNIKVRPDGTVKVLDFGLAKSVTASSDSSSSAAAHSPTITTPAMTHAGVVLGTAAYMSPEQAKGRVVDRRADIWAFGCVLFEMLTGRRAFAGDDVSETFVSILRDEPKWSLLPADVPANVRALLMQCLRKDPRKRLPHIGVARLELSEPAATAVAAPPARGRRIVVAATALLSLLIGAAAASMWLRPAPASPPLRLSAELGLPPNFVRLNTIALSPDGKLLAFVATAANDLQSTALYLRSLDRTDAQLMPGTERAASPMFSPDGQWIAFFSGGQLKKVGVNAGPATTVAEARGTAGGSWIDNEALVFASPAGFTRVQMTSGQSELIYQRGPNDPPVESPQVLPGGNAVLYVEIPNLANATIAIRDLRTGEKKTLQRGRVPRYVESGHLIYAAGGTLLAMPFNLKTLESGTAVPVVEGVAVTAGGALPLVALSASGTLAYIAGPTAATSQAPVMWLTRDGPLTPLRATPATWGHARLSPDGRRLAMALNDGAQRDIWVYDLDRDIMNRVTTDPREDFAPVWTPDGTAMVFSSNRATGTYTNLYWQRADGAGAAVRLTTDQEGQLAGAFSPNGREVIFHAGDPATSRQRVMVLSLTGLPPSGEQPPPKEFVGGDFLKANPRFSPDGKWVSYAANYSGTYEVYVQPFPGPGTRVRVSSGGGNLAIWSPIRNELFYVGPGQGRLTMVPFTVLGGEFRPSKPQQWSPTLFSAVPPFGTFGPSFDIDRDGQRFVVAPPIAAAAANSPHVMLFFNFFDELRRFAPAR